MFDREGFDSSSATLKEFSNTYCIHPEEMEMYKIIYRKKRLVPRREMTTQLLTERQHVKINIPSQKHIMRNTTMGRGKTTARTMGIVIMRLMSETLRLL
eukprot:11377891-Ditylum_brightwellii.AAC.2